MFSCSSAAWRSSNLMSVTSGGTVAGRFSELLAKLEAVIWEADAATLRVSFVSRRAAELLGYPQAQWFSEIDFLLRHIPISDREAVQACFRAVAQDGVDRRIEYRMVTAAGGTLWFRTEVHGSRDENGRVTTLAAMMLDITERVRAERGLADREESFRMMFEANPHPMWVYDIETLRFLEVNDASIAQYGYSREEFLAMTLKDIRPADEVERLLSALSTYPEHRPMREYPTSFRHRRKDGTLIDVEITTHALEFAGRRARLSLARDVTERMRVEEAKTRLLATEQEARAVAVEAQRRVEFLYGATGQVGALPLDFGERLRALPRVVVPELGDWAVAHIVRPDGSIESVEAAHVDPTRAETLRTLRRRTRIDLDSTIGIALAVRTAQPVVYLDIENEHLTPDHPDRPVGTRDPEQLALFRELGIRSYAAVPLVVRGYVMGALTVISATDPKRYLPADLALLMDLARRAALALDNARLYAEAQESIRAREEFLSVASHELRTPVTSLQLAVQSVIKLLETGQLLIAPPEFIGSVLEAANRQSRRLEKLVEDLLDVSRISAGRLELSRADVDLGDVVAEVVAQMRDEAAAAECELSIDLQSGVQGKWDRLRLEQVATNLLSNAIKYGAGHPVHVAVEGDGGHARLCVRDHGIGIAEDMHARIFERFERAVPARNYGGLGLGLYIARRIVEAHGGHIAVASESGQGATFTVLLPRVL
jgi:PAS domain S-box-containing protein